MESITSVILTCGLLLVGSVSSYTTGSCDFSSPHDSCGYTLPIRWMIYQGQYRFHQRVTLIKGGKGDDFYAFFDSSSPIEQLNMTVALRDGEPRNTSYDLTSPVISPGTYRLSYWTILPATQSALDVLLVPVNGTTATVIFSSHGKEDNWNQTSLEINSTDSFQITFRGYRWAYGQFIGIDDIHLDPIDLGVTTFKPASQLLPSEPNANTPTILTEISTVTVVHPTPTSTSSPEATYSPPKRIQPFSISSSSQTPTLESSFTTQTPSSVLTHNPLPYSVFKTDTVTQEHTVTNVHPNTHVFGSSETTISTPQPSFEHIAHTHGMISTAYFRYTTPTLSTPLSFPSSLPEATYTPEMISTSPISSTPSGQSQSNSFEPVLVGTSRISPIVKFSAAPVSSISISPSSTRTSTATPAPSINISPSLPLPHSSGSMNSVSQQSSSLAPTPDIFTSMSMSAYKPIPLASTQAMTNSSQMFSGTSPSSVLTLEEVIHLDCTNTQWNITIDMKGLRQLYPNASRDNIFFGDISCVGTEVGDYLVFQHGLRQCLTGEQISDDKLIYENDLFYAIFDPQLPIIRQHKWTFSLECDVGRNEVTSTHVHHDVESHHAAVTFHYDVNLAFFTDPNFNQVISGSPLHVRIGDDVYVKVYTTGPDWTIKMHVHTCYTKPDDSSPEQTKYYLIKDGCEMDRNTHIISQSTHETRFVFRDFEYPANHEGLNIYCDATFCKTMDYSARCLQVCNPGAGN